MQELIRFSSVIIMARCLADADIIFLPCGFFLWSPYVIGQTIIFLPCYFYLLFIFFFSSLNLSGRRVDVYHTFVHMVWP